MQAHDQKKKQKAGLPWGVLALAAMIGVVCGIGMLELMRLAASPVPGVGDIVTFGPHRPVAQDITARLLVERPGEEACVLDVTAMRQSGGSLIVEERRPSRNPLLRVHWSGLRTSGDNRNCGAVADLMLRASDLEILALGAGGYGVTGQRTASPVAWMNTARALP